MFAIYQKFIIDLLSTESKEIKPSSQEVEQTTVAFYTMSGHLSCHVTGPAHRHLDNYVPFYCERCCLVVQMQLQVFARLQDA